jgi:hypothetical protein
MLESEPWRALTLSGRLVLDRLMIEHMAHAGTQNGELIVTYDQFLAFGISSRRAVAQGIEIAVALGFLDITARGYRAFGSARRPARYGLTWLPRCDGTLASNRWKRFSSSEEAEAAVKAIISARRARRTRATPASIPLRKVA